MFCKATPAKTQACGTLQFDRPLETGQAETTKSTKNSKSMHTSSRRMPSGAHIKMHIYTVDTPYLLMLNTTQAEKQTDKNHHRGIHHIKHWAT